MKLNELIQDTISQSMTKPSISTQFSDGFKKNSREIFTTLFFIMAAASSMTAHADNTANVMYGLSAGAGLASNNVLINLPPECSGLQPTNGYVVAGGGAFGTVVGHQIGHGKGNKVATILGGVIGAGLAAGQQSGRQQADCDKIIAANRATNASNLIGYAPVLYQSVDNKRQVHTITINDSIGYMALTGALKGNIPLNSDSRIESAVMTTLTNLSNTYQQLDNSAKDYLKLVNGEGSVETRYATNTRDIQQNTVSVQKQARQLMKLQDDLSVKFASQRSIAAKILDQAAKDNVDLSSVRNYAPMIAGVPYSSEVAYSTAHQGAPKPNLYDNGL